MSDLNAKHFMKHTVFVMTLLSLSLSFFFFQAASQWRALEEMQQ